MSKEQYKYEVDKNRNLLSEPKPITLNVKTELTTLTENR